MDYPPVAVWGVCASLTERRVWSVERRWDVESVKCETVDVGGGGEAEVIQRSNTR